MSDFRKEFPDFPAEDMPTMPEGFVDLSWHNEAAPQFISEALRLSICVDYKDPSLREAPDAGGRFFLFNTDAHGMIEGDAVLCTDDWNTVLHRVADIADELAAQVRT